eukprot:gene21197-22112_t
MIEKRNWYCYPEVLQFGDVPSYITERLKNQQATISRLTSLSVQEVGALVKNWQWAKPIKDLANMFPQMDVRHEVAPITATIIRVKVELIPYFKWSARHHGMVEPWHIFVQDSDGEKVHHKEFVLLNKKEVNDPRWDIPEKELIKKELNFTLPIRDGKTHFIIMAVSDRWINAEGSCDMILNHIAPSELKPFTELLPLNPLELKTVLVYPKYRQIMKFTHLNSVQTQCFHTLYHSDNNVLFGSPTGSGKTVAAELAMFRVFNLAAENEGSGEVRKDKVVYVAPLKALVKERVRDWTKRLHDVLGKTVCELSGDHTPDGVALVVLDEVHMLGGDRGPILDARTTQCVLCGVRIIGLSTALANAVDLASWMGIDRP